MAFTRLATTNVGTVANFPPALAIDGFNFGQYHIRAARYIAPFSGTLAEIYVQSDTPNGTPGNLKGVVYDTGVAIPGLTYPHSTPPALGVRTRAWTGSAVVFNQTAGTYISLGTPNIPVAAGMHLDIGVMGDDAVGKLRGINRVSGWGNLPAACLPCPGGVTPKLVWDYGAASFTPPDTVAEGSATATVAGSPLLVARFA